MATLKELEDALRNAHAAGATEDARALATEIQRVRGETEAPKPAEFKVSPGTRYDIAGVPQIRKMPEGVGTMAREMGTGMAAATAGQLIGTTLAPGPGTVIGGMIGGGVGNVVNQLQRMAEDPEYKFQWGEFASDVGTAAFPGGPLAAKGIKPILKEGVKQAGIGLAGAETQSLVDRGRLLSAEEAGLAAAPAFVGGSVAQKMQASSPTVTSAVLAAEGQRSMKSKSAQAGQKLGLKVIPSQAEPKPSAVTKLEESLAGKEAVRQEVQRQNIEPVNRAIKEDLGLPVDRDVSLQTLRQLRDQAGEVYGEIGQIGATGKQRLEQVDELRKRMTNISDPAERAIREAEFEAAFKTTTDKATMQAKADVQRLRELRAESRRRMDNYYNSDGKLPDELTKALDARKQAEQLELDIETAVRKMGKPELADKLQAARERIAKSYNAEEALNLATGDFNALTFGKQLDRGVPLSGNMKTVAEFQQAFKQSFGDPANIPTSGVNKLGLLARTLGAAAIGSQTQSPLAAAATFVAPDIAKRRLLSEGVQRAAVEKLSPKIEAGAPVQSVLARTAGQEVAQEGSQGPEITRAAVDFLIQNPDTAAAFDAKYGAGLAKRILDANRR